MECLMHTITPREILSANHMFYNHGVLHPDRVLKEHDLVYLVDGDWEICQDGAVYQLYPDDVLLLTAGAHHYGLTPCSDQTKTMYIHVSADQMDRRTGREETDEKSFVLLEPLTHCRKNSEVKRLFQEIIHLYWSCAKYKETEMSALFHLLLCELAGCSHSSGSEQTKTADEIARLIQYNPQKFFGLEELSGQFSLCSRTLDHRFREVYGQSVYRYQMETKLESVRFYLLSHPEIRLYEVALNFGFYDEFHLSKAFKKKFGISPSEYKKQQQK